jgi:putative FmdB family regulatory protein
MPTYEYACPKCGIVECFQSIKDPALTKCPQCKRAKVTRLLSTGGGIIFKGSGFWETDYNRSADYKKQQSSESESGSKPAAAAETKAQTATKMQKADSAAKSPAPAPAP